MVLIMCIKFQINRIILTLFSGVWDKNPTPVAEKVVKCRRQLVLMYKAANRKFSNSNVMYNDVHQSSFQLVYHIQDTCYVMVE